MDFVTIVEIGKWLTPFVAGLAVAFGVPKMRELKALRKAAKEDKQEKKAEKNTEIEVANKGKEIDLDKDAFAIITARLTATEARTDQKIDVLGDKIESLQEKLLQTMAENHKLAAENESLKRDNAELRHDNSELRDRIRKLEIQLGIILHGPQKTEITGAISITEPDATR